MKAGGATKFAIQNPQFEILKGRHAFVSGTAMEMAGAAEMQTVMPPMKTASRLVCVNERRRK